MTKPLLAILLLLPLSVSAGELDGKSIICRADFTDDQTIELLMAKSIIRAARFENSNVHLDQPELVGTKLTLNKMVPLPYRESPKEVQWWWMDDYSLDRQTLILSTALRGKNLRRYQCTVFLTLSDYWKKMDELMDLLQEMVDEAMEANKI